MPVKIEKISNIALWACMIISLVIFGIFFLGGTVDSSLENTEPRQTSVLLYWMYILFIIVFSTTLLFFIWQFIKKCKSGFRQTWQSIIPVLIFAALLGITFGVGSGKLLEMPTYEGSENTYVWLKITDMWLYSIYVLLGLVIVSIVTGIIVSYTKK